MLVLFGIKSTNAKAVARIRVLFGWKSLCSPICTEAKKGLSHLDAEVVIGFSSAYKGTPESQSTAKKYT